MGAYTAASRGCVVGRKGRALRRAQAVAAQAAAGGAEAERALQTRRAALGAGAAFVSAAWGGAARAVGVDSEPVFRALDKSANTCDFGEKGDECRQKTLIEDEGKLDYGASTQTRNQIRGPGRANGADANTSKYELETLQLVTDIEDFLAMDVYDRQRAAKVPMLQKEGKTWVASYAQGGSCKKASGRALNNGLNQLLGHFSFNGIAPLSPSTEKAVVSNLAMTRDLIAQQR